MLDDVAALMGPFGSHCTVGEHTAETSTAAGSMGTLAPATRGRCQKERVTKGEKESSAAGAVAIKPTDYLLKSK